MKIRVAIAEDHQSLVDGLTAYISKDEHIEIVGTAINGKEALKIIEETTVDVLICDVRMPEMNGIELTKHLSKHFPKVYVIAFSMFDQPEAINQMKESGVKGYVLKNSPLETVITAIKEVYLGKTYFKLPNQPNKVVKPISIRLSRREKEILEEIANGRTSKEIASVLFIEKTTVDTHRKNIKRKLKLSGNNDLLKYALSNKFK